MTRRRDDRQRGSILLEFALVALAFFFLMATTLEMGRATFLAQAAQGAARTAARELSLVALPAASTFEQALADPAVRTGVYDDRWLVIDQDAPDNPDTVAVEATLDELFASLPPVNRALRPLMISETVDLGAGPRRLLRMPGTLLASAQPGVEFTVQVPLVLDRDDDTGAETDLIWARVVEEVRPDPADPTSGGFAAVGGAGGLVSLRVNVPLQSGLITAHRPNPEGPFEPNIGQVIAADEAAALAGLGAPLDGATVLGPPDEPVGPYAGSSGLGALYAQGQVVRPFRRVLSGQAVFRRELLLP